MVGSRVIGFVVVAHCVACAPEDVLPELRYETEHLRIGTDFDEEPCQGSLSRLELYAAHAAEILDVEIGEPIELYWYEEGAPPGCPEAFGCYQNESRRVLTPWAVAPHELGHAIAYAGFGTSPPDEFFSEGAADAFTGRHTQFGWQSPSLAIGAENPFQIDFPSAGHFVRWLHMRDGSDKLLRLLDESSAKRGRRHAERAFEKTYGATLAEVEAEYWATAPDILPADLFCAFPTVGSMTAGFEAEVMLDCSEEHTRGIRWMERAHTFQVDSPGWYVLELADPGRALVWYCFNEEVELGDDLPDIRLPVRAGGQDELVVQDDWWLDSGTRLLFLDVGTYRLDVRVEHQDPEGVLVRGHPLVLPGGIP